MKRLFDIVVAAVALVILSPLLIATAFACRIAVGSPVLFRHRRPGMGGSGFTLYKFRTMSDARNRDGVLLPDDERLTSFGRFLRRTSIDELPELVNVVKGEMSLVGPRPLLSDYLPLYDSRQARRHTVRPGITGWAQVNGRNAVTWTEKFDYDLWYIENRTFLLDMRILFVTVKRVFLGEGINQPGHATAQRFEGNTDEAASRAKPPAP